MKENIYKVLEKCKELKIIDLIWLLLIPIINVNYFLASILAKNTVNLSTTLDRSIKFNEIFIIPYVYWYAYVVIGFIIIMRKDRERYMKCIIATLLGMSISYCIFYLFPTQISRPIVVNDNILNKLVNVIYHNDRPVNCFPSLHVLNAYFIMRYTKREHSKNIFWYTQIVGVLIILSTIFIKQHFIVDIIASIIICEIVIYYVNGISTNSIKYLLNRPYVFLDKSKPSIEKVFTFIDKLNNTAV